jgi:hypothetical protein
MAIIRFIITFLWRLHCHVNMVVWFTLIFGVTRWQLHRVCVRSCVQTHSGQTKHFCWGLWSYYKQVWYNTYIEQINNKLSEQLLFNAKWTIFQPYHGENKLEVNEKQTPVLPLLTHPLLLVHTSCLASFPICLSADHISHRCSMVNYHQNHLKK